MSNKSILNPIKFSGHFLFFIISMAVVLFPSITRAATVSISPGDFNFGLVRSENSIKKTTKVTVISDNADESIELIAQKDGIGSEAIQLDSEKINFQAGETQQVFGFTVNPKNLSPGKYHTKIFFLPSHDSLLNSGSSLNLKLTVNVDFEVTTKLVRSIETFNEPNLLYGKPGGQIKFNFFFNNTGNTDEIIDEVKLKLTEKKINKELSYIPPEIFQLGAKNTIQFTTIFNLPKDWPLSNDYLAQISYYNHGQLLKELQDIPFHIEDLSLVKKKFNWQIWLEGILVVIFLILVVKYFKR